MDGGFAESPLKLNAGLGQVERWDMEAIQARANRLAEQALNVWPAATLTDDVLASYSPEPASTSYTISDHKHLDGGITRKLFDAFRKEVLALDACVFEEFFKHYVAFKAETNFVDVVPQAQRLRLSLNMPFSEIEDSRGLCRDVTNIGRWGNGDVEVILAAMDDLPYIMSLVNQSFERQMGNGDEG
jgi:predicted transport protein